MVCLKSEIENYQPPAVVERGDPSIHLGGILPFCQGSTPKQSTALSMYQYSGRANRVSRNYKK